jgi:hypothetical protein
LAQPSSNHQLEHQTMRVVAKPSETKPDLVFVEELGRPPILTKENLWSLHLVTLLLATWARKPGGRPDHTSM